MVRKDYLDGIVHRQDIQDLPNLGISLGDRLGTKLGNGTLMGMTISGGFGQGLLAGARTVSKHLINAVGLSFCMCAREKMVSAVGSTLAGPVCEPSKLAAVSALVRESCGLRDCGCWLLLNLGVGTEHEEGRFV